MAGQNPDLTSSANWSEIVKAMYPDILTTTHSVPPFYFNRVPYLRQIVSGTDQPALVLQEPSVAGAAPVHDLTPDSQQPTPSPPRTLWNVEPPRRILQAVRQKGKGKKKQTELKTAGPTTVQETDVKDDTAQALVLRKLQELGESQQEAMFIISQLNYNEYLNQPAYAAAVAQLPKVPLDLTTGRQQEGDFDILLIHRQFGILLGELKTVGKHRASRTDAIVDQTIQKALKQLDKSKDVMDRLVSDVASPDRLTVRTTLFLPYVSREKLESVLDANPQLKQHACSTLGAANASEAVQLCCCEDHLLMSPAMTQPVLSWWQKRMNSPDPHLTDSRYLDIVARFVGPATSVTVHCTTGPRVQVKTLGQAVSELGRRLTTLVLTPEQVDIMQQLSLELLPPLVYLTGPPGTGKTVMLTLVGLRRLRQGKDVHVVSVWNQSMLASRLIKNQLETTLAAGPTSPSGTVFLHDYDLRKEAEKDRAVSELAALGDDVFVIADELTGPGTGFGLGVGLGSPRYVPSLLTELHTQAPHLRLWAAGILHSVTLSQMTEVPLQTPLRSAPAVVRQVEVGMAGSFWLSRVHPYNNTRFLAAADGPRVERLAHGGTGHTDGFPEGCYRCGQDVAAALRRLGVGDPAGAVTYRDVLILSLGMTRLTKVVTDDVNTTTDVCDLLRAVQNAGLAVRVLGGRDADRATWQRVAGEIAGATQDSIMATSWENVHGMERKVVVLLDDDPFLQMFTASRATTHLITVTR